MRYQLAAAALIAGASATYDYTKNTTSVAYPEYPEYTTEVVTEYTTYCPEPTEIEHGGTTYTVTEATTLTISDCPCTITKPVETPVYPPPAGPTSKPGEAPKPSAPPAAPPAVPTVPAPPAPYPSGNATVPAPPAGTGTPVESAPPEFTGAATKAGVGLVALLAGLVAFL